MAAKIINWSTFDYSILKETQTIDLKIKKVNGAKVALNNAVMMADTETSKLKVNPVVDVEKSYFDFKDNIEKYYIAKKYEPIINKVIKWSFAIRINHINIVTLWGNKPSEFAECLGLVMQAMPGTHTILYFHNLRYDWVFLRRFLFNRFGKPEQQLNTKARTPIRIKWKCGLELRDSVILANASLERWANNMNVEHKKAVGKWDYKKLRNQKDLLNDDEVEYFTNDVLAGVECIDAYMEALNYDLSTIPLTATGHNRKEIIRLANAPENAQKAERLFSNTQLTFEQFKRMEQIYHGGFTHANRDYINFTCKGTIQCMDFASSYPYIMLALPEFETGNYSSVNMTLDEILDEDMLKDFAFTFKLTIKNLDMKAIDSMHSMPTISISKCDFVSEHYKLDNGRILSADEVVIYTNELDLQVYLDTYRRDETHTWEVSEVEAASKGYLPLYIRKLVFELFTNKTVLKGQGAKYALAKAILNALYGMCCQNPVKFEMIEDYETFEYNRSIEKLDEDTTRSVFKKSREEVEDAKLEAGDKLFTEGNLYHNWLVSNLRSNKSTKLPFQWGARISSCAFKNLITLSHCIAFDSVWIYSDTDSIYAWNAYGRSPWDMDKVAAYNNNCKDLIRAAGFGCVEFNNREYWLGVAESGPEDIATEFKTMGAKRYVKRVQYIEGSKDCDGKLHLTVSGIPKDAVECLNNDIENFKEGFVFEGTKTGKNMAAYISHNIAEDEQGDEYADSVDLIPCDYLLSATHLIEDDEYLFNYDIDTTIA